VARVGVGAERRLGPLCYDPSQIMSLPEWVDLPSRKPTRNPNHDYNSSAGYHIVICTADRIPLFGKVVDAKMQLNGIGRMVAESIQHHFTSYPGVELKTCGIMPNHLHLLSLFLDPQITGRTVSPVQVIQRLKAYTATTYLKWRNSHPELEFPYKLWQGSFWDRVLRDEDDMLRVWEYIENNPIAWHLARRQQRA